MSEKILIVGPSWVGDTVMAQSLFRLLKERRPECSIDIIAPAWTFSLITCMPEIAQAIELPISHGELNLSLRYQIAQKLKTANYQQAIVLPNSFKSALIPWMANIPVRTGWLRECRGLLLNDGRRLDKKRFPLMIEQYLALGLSRSEPLKKPYPLPKFFISRETQVDALTKFRMPLKTKRILGIAAGAEFGPSKRWPEAYYAEVANAKLHANWDVWLFGSPKDKSVSDRIMQLTDHKCHDLTGITSLSESIALMSILSGMVCNDSGLMHVAAALQKPVIAIYGSTSPDFTPPLSETAQVVKLNLPCQPCFERNCPLLHHQCMQALRPDQVLTAMRSWEN